jgi:predicted nucleotidyltransferase
MTTLNLLKDTFQTLSSTHPDLNLLVLFGSRARNEADSTSDWDFAVRLEPIPVSDRPPFWFPGSDLIPTLSHLLQVPDEKLDIVDLSRCSEILSHFIARDGKLIYEKTPGEFAKFQQHALKTKAELKEFRRKQRAQVLQALERWGVEYAGS